jgi:hypothetical protein
MLAKPVSVVPVEWPLAVVVKLQREISRRGVTCDDSDLNKPRLFHAVGKSGLHSRQLSDALTRLVEADCCVFGAWDVRRGQVFGRSEPKGGIAPFDRLVWQVMTKEPYASARTVYWIVDNGSSHPGRASVRRLESRWPNLRLIHLPLHASWLNQIEIYFSIIQRKLLRPNDFQSTADVARALNEFEHHYNQIAQPFDWNFTRDDLAELLTRLAERDPQLQLAA